MYKEIDIIFIIKFEDKVCSNIKLYFNTINCIEKENYNKNLRLEY